MKKEPVLTSLASITLVALLLAAANVGAQTVTDPNPNRVVSWNMDNNGTLYEDDLAGVAPAYNWVNSYPDNPTMGLTNNLGEPTTLDLGYGAVNNWSVQGSHPGLDFNGTANKELLNGYLNSGPAGWNPPTTNTYVSLTNVPFARYDVVVYFNSDASGRPATISDGTTTYAFSTMGSASISGDNAVFKPTMQTDESQYPSADFAFFPGLTTGERTFTTYPKGGDEKWLGIAGFQVIESSNVYVLYGPVPASQTVPLGQPASFRVMVGGEGPAIQWRHNGVDIPDATNATYTIASTAAGQDGSYDVVVSNGYSTMTSSAATLSFYEPKTLEWSGGGSYWDTGSAYWTADGGATTTSYTETDDVIFDSLGAWDSYISLGAPVSPSSIVVSNASYTLSQQSLQGSGSLSVVDNGMLTLDLTDDRSGSTYIESGSTLQVGNGGLTGVLGSGALTNDGALVFNLAADLAYGYPIHGSGSVSNIGFSGLVTLGSDVTADSLIQAGEGQMLLQGNNTLSSGMTISSGQVWARSEGSLGGSQVTVSGGELQVFFGFTYTGTPIALAGGILHGGLNGSQTIEDVVSLTADSEIDVESGNSLTLSHPSGLAGGSHMLAVGGTGTLILTGTNNTWGSVNIFTGNLRIGDGGTAGSLGAGAIQVDDTLSFNLASDLALGNELSGIGIVSQEGSGTVTITAQNTGFQGALVVSNGTLLVNGGTGSGLATVAGGVLGGTGTIGSSVDLQAGGTLAPGASVGTLTINGDLSIAGNLAVDVNKSLTQSNDMTQVSGTLYNTGSGVVNVSNLGPALQVGDTFQLFNQAVSGSSTMTIAGGGATWNNNLETDGSISVASVVAVSQPEITGTKVVGTDLVISGANGAVGGTYQVLSSTNAAAPLANWAQVGTGNFDGSGAFSVTNAIDANEPQRFYLLKVP